MKSLFVTATLLLVLSLPSSAETRKSPSAAKAATVTFGGVDYVHRWSKNGQNEFTPQAETDLAKWRDMVTINVFDKVSNGDQLAGLANAVLGNYQSHGKIVRTDSKPRTAQSPAEHLIVAILVDRNYLEAAFARAMLVDGKGMIAVYSHRVYGQAAGPAMSEWLEKNGPQTETTLMRWQNMPALATLKQLPQSR
jgi:hypothetical protein